MPKLNDEKEFAKLFTQRRETAANEAYTALKRLIAELSDTPSGDELYVELEANLALILHDLRAANG